MCSRRMTILNSFFRWLHRKKQTPVVHERIIKNYTKIHPRHALKQCVDFINNQSVWHWPNDWYILGIEFTDNTHVSQFNVKVYVDKSSRNETLLLTAIECNNIPDGLSPEWRELLELRTQSNLSCVDVMRTFDKLHFDTPLPLRLSRISLRRFRPHSKQGFCRLTHREMYNVAEDEPCALDASVRNAAASVITRAWRGSLCVARMRAKRVLRAALEELVYAPPGTFVTSFPGGVGYEESKRSFSKKISRLAGSGRNPVEPCEPS